MCIYSEFRGRTCRPPGVIRKIIKTSAGNRFCSQILSALSQNYLPQNPTTQNLLDALPLSILFSTRKMLDSLQVCLSVSRICCKREQLDVSASGRYMIWFSGSSERWIAHSESQISNIFKFGIVWNIESIHPDIQ